MWSGDSSESLEYAAMPERAEEEEGGRVVGPGAVGRERHTLLSVYCSVSGSVHDIQDTTQIHFTHI